MVLRAVDDWLEYVRTNLGYLTVYYTEIFAVALLTQMFYCYRIAVLTKSKYAVIAITLVREKLLSAVVFFLISDDFVYNSSSLFRSSDQL